MAPPLSVPALIRFAQNGDLDRLEREIHALITDRNLCTRGFMAAAGHGQVEAMRLLLPHADPMANEGWDS